MRLLMMKSAFVLIVIAACICSIVDGVNGMGVARRNNPCGDNLDWTFDERTGVLVINGTGDMYDFNITNQSWASSMSLIKSVVIEEGATSIGTWAFISASSLASVRLPDTLRSIGKYAFHNTSLRSVTIPKSVTSLGFDSFSKCTELTELQLLANVDTIGYSVFSGCSKLESVEIPSSVTTIGKYSFYSTGLKAINIPNSVTQIREDAFGACNNLVSVTLSKSLQTIETEGFHDCVSLTSIFIPASVEEIQRYAFSGCVNLASFEVDKGNSVYSSKDGVVFNQNKTQVLLCPEGKSG